jgi:hypothetical protein
VADGDIVLDEAAIFELLNAPDGPVGRLLMELGERAAAVARAKVRVRHGNTWSRRSDARPPGYTLASIHPVIGYDSQGLIYGGVHAAGDPGIFLEYPAEQETREYPFLTTGLDSLELLWHA